MTIADPAVSPYPDPPAPTRARRIRDELVIALDRGLALVQSKTDPDVWHVVEQGRCSCKGFHFSKHTPQTCRHLAVAEDAAAALARENREDPYGIDAMIDASEAVRALESDDDDALRIFGKLR